MKVLIISNNIKSGYYEAELLANNFSEDVQLPTIISDGEEQVTGGFILKDTPEIREILDLIPEEKQYEAIKALRFKPSVEKEYFCIDPK